MKHDHADVPGGGHDLRALRAAVTEEFRAVAGVEDVSVDLVPGEVSTVTVVSVAPLDPSVVRAAVDEAGYELVE